MTTGQTPKSQVAPDDEPLARFIGYANPLGLTPAFVMPVFERDGVHVLQVAGEDEKITGFAAYNVNSFGPIKKLDRKILSGGVIRLFMDSFSGTGALISFLRMNLRKNLSVKRGAWPATIFFILMFLST